MVRRTEDVCVLTDAVVSHSPFNLAVKPFAGCPRWSTPAFRTPCLFQFPCCIPCCHPLAVCLVVIAAVAVAVLLLCRYRYCAPQNVKNTPVVAACLWWDLRTFSPT